MMTLYGTTGCHLCDQAESLLRQVAAAQAISWHYVDIALDPVLVERFGTRIPVLVDAAGREYGWPFSLLDICAMS
jgi:hypothetical protein